MSKSFYQHLLINGLLGCALPNGIINGAIAYFTGHEKTFTEAILDISFTLGIVVLLVTLIIIPVMRKLAHTIPQPGFTRQDVAFFRILPERTLPLSLTLTVGSVILLGVLPIALLSLLFPAPLSAASYAVFKGAYVGLAAVPANVIATAMAKLTSQPALA